MKNREIKFRAWDKEKKQWLRDFCVHETGLFLHVVNQRNPEPETISVMQFTGLLDKNGKEVFEGDILKAPFFQTAQIEWLGSGFWCKQGENSHALPNMNDAEIIGNVFENPELLTN